MTSAAKSMRIALVGDLHDYALGIWPWELLGKTLAGQANLWLNRRKKFDRSLIKPTIDRVMACQPALTLFSGDLTTTSRPREFRSIAATLAPLLDSCESVIVAGNHDRYTFTAQRLRRIERTFVRRTPETFPFTRPLIGGWRLIAVDSAVPRLLDSQGRIGTRQMQHVQAMLKSMREDEAAIVLVHYPFGKPSALPPMKPGHRLIDESEWRDTLHQSRSRIIVVHGHVHCPWLWRVTNDIDGSRRSTIADDLNASSEDDANEGSMREAGRIWDVNAGSPTMTSAAWPRGQGFWMVELPADPAKAVIFTHHVQADSQDRCGEAPIGFDPVAPPQRDAASPGWCTRTARITLS